jgi:hypothetical protein
LPGIIQPEYRNTIDLIDICTRVTLVTEFAIGTAGCTEHLLDIIIESNSLWIGRNGRISQAVIYVMLYFRVL